MELGEPDEKGRRKPVPVEGSNWILDVDTVVIAIGTSPNPLIRNTTKGLTFTRKGGIEADEGGATAQNRRKEHRRVHKEQEVSPNNTAQAPMQSHRCLFLCGFSDKFG